MYGGLVQLLAGMQEYRNRNVFGATAFSTYGGFSLGLGIVVVFANLSKGFAGALTAHPGDLPVAVFTVFLTLEATEILLVIGFFDEAHGVANNGWLHTGGWVGIVTAAAAWYASAAGVVNGMSEKPVLPVGSPLSTGTPRLARRTGQTARPAGV